MGIRNIRVFGIVRENTYGGRDNRGDCKNTRVKSIRVEKGKMIGRDEASSCERLEEI